MVVECQHLCSIPNHYHPVPLVATTASFGNVAGERGLGRSTHYNAPGVRHLDILLHTRHPHNSPRFVCPDYYSDALEGVAVLVVPSADCFELLDSDDELLSCLSCPFAPSSSPSPASAAFQLLVSVPSYL